MIHLTMRGFHFYSARLSFKCCLGNRKVKHIYLTNWTLIFKAISFLSHLKEKPEVTEVKSTKSITTLPEGRVVIHGHSRISVCMRLTAMTEENQHKALPERLRLSPTVFHLASGKSCHRVPIEISNFSSKTSTLTPKMTLCSLQQVTQQK